MGIYVDKVVKFNAQTAGREKLIRLCQYTTKFVSSLLHLYYTRYSKGGQSLLECLYKLRELEQYFLSCRRLLSFGRCSDQLYSALRSMQLNDPIIRMTLATSKFWSSLQLFSDHVLWMHHMGILKIQSSPIWAERASRFWLYSAATNLLRDFYELICVYQQRRSRDKDNLDSELRNFKVTTPIRWLKSNPKLGCDLIKNICDFSIPYISVNKVPIHHSLIGLLGIISTTMGILQIYDKDFRLSPS